MRLSSNLQFRAFVVENDRHKKLQAYYFYNEKNDPERCFVLCNPFTANMSVTQPYAEYLCEHGYNAVIFDFSGGSYDSASEGSFLEMSAISELYDLKAVLSKLKTFGIKKFFLLGISQGGLVAAMEAAQDPQDILALVLFYPAFVIPDYARMLYRTKDQIPEHPDALGLEVGRMYYADVIELDFLKEIENFKGPVIIFHGTEDFLVPIQYSQKAVRHYNQAVLYQLNYEGHGFGEFAWQACMEKTIEFLKENGF